MAFGIDRGITMYAFKVMVTTLMLILIGTLAYSGVKAKGSGKSVSLIMIVIEALGIIAIWG